VSELLSALGTALGDRYEVLRQLGEGAHGVVYLARDLRHDRRVAVKVLRAEDAPGDGLELRFIREIRLLARLQHPNILPLHDSGHFGVSLYYVMPYVNGESLRDRLRRERIIGIGDAVAIARELADALDCAHAAGVVHRDVKPENILLASGRPLLADFGVAAALNASPERRITKTGDRAPGTPAYMSPEQLIGEGPIDGRVDVYALGCVLFEMITGTAPFTGPAGFAKRFTEPPPSMLEKRPDTPARLDAVVRRALEREPERRFATAGELALALAVAQEPGLVHGARPRKSTARASRTSLRPTQASWVAIESTSFVGRQREIDTLGRLLSEHRLVTILGQGGAGKTRLARQVASHAAAGYAHGVRFVPLGGITDADLAWATIGEVVGVSSSAQGDARARVLTVLRRRRVLLVLDDFERLSEEVGPRLVPLIEHAPGVRVLVTSRERLNLSAEVVLELSGLPTPAPDRIFQHGEHEALELFVDRARHVLPAFELTEELRPVISELCVLVDGLPLAIELAASLLRVLDCQELVKELRGSFDVLATGLRDVPERHRSLRAVFDQSWRLLPDEERDALMRLSVFAAGFSREAAMTIGKTSLTVLRTLNDKSLLQHNGPDRYQLHSVIRQHAIERFPASIRAEVAYAHARYYGDFMLQCAPRLEGSEQKSAAAEIIAELPDVRAGWRHAASIGDEQLLETYIDGLYQLFLQRSWFREGAAEFAVASIPGRASTTAGRILARQGKFLLRLGAFSSARVVLGWSIAILRKQNEQRELLLPLRSLGVLGAYLGRYEAAERLLRRAIRLAGLLGLPHELALAHIDLAYAVTPQGRAGEVEALLRTAMSLIESLGDESAMAVAATSLGALLLEENRNDEAREILERALVSSRALGNERIAASALLNLGALAAQSGEHVRGEALCRESLVAFRNIGVEEGAAAALVILGELEMSRGVVEKSKRHYLDALQVAISINAEFHVMAALVGLAELYRAAGDSARALELLACALASRATDARHRDKARSLMAEIMDGAPSVVPAGHPPVKPVSDVVRRVLESERASPA
jgi:serine/threonine protein kinase/tetratricopeptide (TPR) repeat protein